MVEFEPNNPYEGKAFDFSNPAENQFNEDQKQEQPQSNQSTKDGWQPDRDGKVDIRNIAQSFIDDEPENAGTFEHPADKPPAQEPPKPTNGQAASSKNGETEPGKVDMQAKEFIDGELAFETIDFFLVAGLCILAKTEDENRFNLAPGRRKKLIYVWEKYLESIDYKIPIHYALILLYTASYGPMTWKAFKDGKEQKKSAEANTQQQPAPKPVINNEEIKIPEAPTIVLPKKPGGGNFDKYERSLHNIIKDISKNNEELRNTMVKMQERMNIKHPVNNEPKVTEEAEQETIPEDEPEITPTEPDVE